MTMHLHEPSHVDEPHETKEYADVINQDAWLHFATARWRTWTPLCRSKSLTNNSRAWQHVIRADTIR
jgi:hypothetical protein